MKTHAQNQIRRDFVLGGKTYRLVDNPDLSEADKADPNTVLLALKEYTAGSNGTHGFFSTMPPEDILSELTQKMTTCGQEFTVSATTWKVNFECNKQINQPPEADDEEESKEKFEPVIESAHVQFEILRVPGKDQLVFAQFKRKAGAAILFYEKAKLYKDALHLFNNANEEGEAQ